MLTISSLTDPWTAASALAAGPGRAPGGGRRRSAGEADRRPLQRHLVAPDLRSGQGLDVRGGRADDELVEVRDVAGEREAAEHERQAFGGDRLGVVHDLEVQVRPPGRTGVAEAGDDLAGVHALADLDP